MLDVQNLSISIGDRTLVRDVTFSIAAGERIGLIGGSGSGKTLISLAITGLLPQSFNLNGKVIFQNRNILALPDAEMAELRGEELGIVFQDPKTSLNPLRRLGKTMTAALHKRYTLSRAQRTEAALELAARVGLPERVVNAYQHEVSGGQRQRAAIAAAISASPRLLIADEPTTALDPVVAAGVLELFRELGSADDTALLFISHDLALVSKLCDRVLVLHDGQLIEHGDTADIVHNPQHEITKHLLDAARLGEHSLPDTATPNRTVKGGADA